MIKDPEEAAEATTTAKEDTKVKPIPIHPFPNLRPENTRLTPTRPR